MAGKEGFLKIKKDIENERQDIKKSRKDLCSNF